ncbi:putative ferrochelatase [uncultured Mediterranean phage uvMED]|nr:putative ferrochelatase [uncultured Mediterranean phage uvMED]
MSFQKNKYIVIKEAVPKDIATFVYNYFLLKRQVARTLFDERYISNFTEEWGTWADKQVPGTYSHYADIAMETLLIRTLPIMEKKTGLKLNPTYSYARIYKTGDVLHRHKDRFSCEISTTLNLGGDAWCIYLEPKKNVGIPDGKKITVSSNNKGTKVVLKPGDMLVYRGMELEHWREEFQGNDCCQVFLHYNDQKSKNANQNLYDTRKHLGLPAWFKK